MRLAHESGRLNLRRHAAARIQASGRFAELLTRLEQAVAETRSMARTIGRTGLSASDPRFRAAWLDLLSRAGVAVSGGDGDGVKRVRADLEGPSDSAHSAAARPVHGALLVNLGSIVEAMEAVATPSRCTPPPAGMQGCRPDRRPAGPHAQCGGARIDSDTSPIAERTDPRARRRLPHPLPHGRAAALSMRRRERPSNMTPLRFARCG